tara:strand:- start:300 stop:557 length:258 start_codon:yes stop_codon:yes gene_type:complete
VREIAALGLEMVRFVEGRGGGDGRVNADDRRVLDGRLIDQEIEGGVYLRGEPFWCAVAWNGVLEVVVMQGWKVLGKLEERRALTR